MPVVGKLHKYGKERTGKKSAGHSDVVSDWQSFSGLR